MKIGIQWRHQLSPATLKEMEALIGGLSSWSNEEHNDDGTHENITAVSLVLDAVRGKALSVLTGLTTLGEAIAAPGALTPPALTADVDNYCPNGMDQTFVLRVSASGSAHSIGGLQDGTRLTPIAGRLVWLFNAGSNDIVLTHEALTSRDVLRFKLPGLTDITIPTLQGVLLYYDLTSARWIMLAGSTGVSGTTTLEFDAGDSGAALLVDWANGPQQIVTLTANAAITFANPTFGQEYRLVFVEGGAGGFTPTFGADVVLQNDLDPAAIAAGGEFLLELVYTAADSKYYGTWSQIAPPITHTSGALTVNQLIVGNGADDLKTLPATLDGQIPISKGADGTVAMARITAGSGVTVTNGPNTIQIAASSAGTVTHTGALTANQLVVGNGTDDIKVAPATQDGQIPIGTAADGSVTMARITAGSGVTVTNGAASIQISASGGGDRVITFVVDGGGSAISTGIKADLRIPVACTLKSIEMVADQVGSCVVDLQKDTYTNFPPTNADSIINTGAGGVKPTLSSAIKSQDTTLAHYTTAFSVGDYLRLVIDSASVLTRLTLSATVSVP